MTSSSADRSRRRRLTRTSRMAAGAMVLTMALTAGVAQASTSPRANSSQVPIPGLTPTTGPSTAPGNTSSPKPAPAPAKPGPATVPAAAVDTILTDYTQGFSHWAYTRRTGAAIHSGPGAQFRTVGRLHSNTEDGLPEVYLLLAERTGGRSGKWFKVAIPGRPNGRTGWVTSSSVGSVHLVPGLLVVSARSERMWYYRNGHLAFTAPVGDGKGSTPTPTGHFWIREKFPVPSGYPVYGPYAMGTSDYSNTLTDWPGGGVVGIHGTDQPQLIPGAPSHGCVRLRNGDITRLYRMVSVGTALLVR